MINWRLTSIRHDHKLMTKVITQTAPRFPVQLVLNVKHVKSKDVQSRNCISIVTMSTALVICCFENLYFPYQSQFMFTCTNCLSYVVFILPILIPIWSQSAGEYFAIFWRKKIRLKSKLILPARIWLTIWHFFYMDTSLFLWKIFGFAPSVLVLLLWKLCTFCLLTCLNIIKSHRWDIYLC